MNRYMAIYRLSSSQDLFLTDFLEAEKALTDNQPDGQLAIKSLAAVMRGRASRADIIQ